MARTRNMDVAAFFGLTFVLTIPFWLVGASVHGALMPGLPWSALAVVCPAPAALLAAWRFDGAGGVRALMLSLRTIDIRPRACWLPILLICPLVSLAAFSIMRLGGSAVPDPDVHVVATIELLGVFIAAAVAEEIGWSAYALPRLRGRSGSLPAALLIGVVWSVWHFPALLQAHRTAEWIAWWTVGTIAMRLIIVRLFSASGGNLWAAAIAHAVSNLCWQLFPVRGSWFDPRLNGLLLAGVALTAWSAIAIRHARRRS